MQARFHHDNNNEKNSGNDTDSDNDPNGDPATQVASFLGFRTAHDARIASPHEELPSHTDASSGQRDDFADETLDERPRIPMDEVLSVNPDETPDDRPRIPPGAAHFSAADATLNTVIDDNILMPLLHDGFDRLISASRATVGVKIKSAAPYTTAYCYEIKIVSPWMKDMTLRVGWSKQGSSLLFNDAHSISVDHTNVAYSGEHKMTGGHRTNGQSCKWTKGDIVAMVLLRSTTDGECTPGFAVYVNGVCTTGPLEMPSHLAYCALFPHITFKHCTLAANFGASRWTVPSRACHWRMIAESARGDVEYSLASYTPALPELIVPCVLGPSTWLPNYVDAHPHCVVLSKEALDSWAVASAVHVISSSGEYGLSCLDDGGAAIAALCRRRTIVYALSGLECLLPTERARICALFPHAKITVVVSFAGAYSDTMTTTSGLNNTPHLARYNDASVPSVEENVFDAVTFDEHGEQCAVDTLARWKMDCKLRTRLDDLMVGPWFKQRSSEWRTFLAAEQQKTPHPSFPHFTKEDWMLANLRAQLHHLLVGFQKDVQDSTRHGFTPYNLSFYYKLYFGNDFFTVSSMFAARRVNDLLELVPEVFAHQDGLLVPLLSEKTTAKQLLINTEKARVARQNRLDAGDENAALRFAAPTSHTHGGSGAGGKPKIILRPALEKRALAQITTLEDHIAQKSKNNSGAHKKPRYDPPSSPRVACAKDVGGGVTTANTTNVRSSARRTPEKKTRAHLRERSARRQGRNKSRSARRQNASRSRGNDAARTGLTARTSARQPLAPLDASARKSAGGAGEDRRRRRADDGTRDARGSARRTARR